VHYLGNFNITSIFLYSSQPQKAVPLIITPLNTFFLSFRGNEILQRCMGSTPSFGAKHDIKIANFISRTDMK
jgi:hypothetical protein